MVMVVRILGVAIIVLGLVFIVKPLVLRAYLTFWREKKRIRFGAAIAGVVGIVLLVAAPQCRWTWLIIVFGIWSLIKGVLLLVLSQQKINAYLDWWLNRPTKVLGPLGLLAMVFGALLVCAA